jgi:hypothetical protein
MVPDFEILFPLWLTAHRHLLAQVGQINRPVAKLLRRLRWLTGRGTFAFQAKFSLSPLRHARLVDARIGNDQ